MLSVTYAECHLKALFAEYGYAEYRYAEYQYAECPSALQLKACNSLYKLKLPSLSCSS
jgi:hypothetical protein